MSQTADQWPDSLLSSSLLADSTPESVGYLHVQTDSNTQFPVDVRRWHQPADSTDLLAIHKSTGSVLDIGCGPGRMLLALQESGYPCLGIDISPVAVKVSQSRGGTAVCCSVFDPLRTGRLWDTALLMDGNIGIGGDPIALLTRLGQLLDFDGQIIVEVEAPDVDTTGTKLRVTHGDSQSDWFPWARVSASELPRIASSAGWDIHESWTHAGRWFAQLVREVATS